MVRMLITIAIRLAANAVGLIVAAALLDDMELNGAGFVIAVVIFTIAEVILQPLVMKIAMKNAQALMGGTALVTTLISLILTDLISDGLSISGFVTWLLATLIVWLATLLAGWLLPAIFLKKAVDERRSGNTTTYGR